MEKNNPLIKAKTFIVTHKAKILVGALVVVTTIAAAEHGKNAMLVEYLEEKELLQDFDDWLAPE